MKRPFRNLFSCSRLYIVLAFIITLFVFGYFFEPVFVVAKMAFGLLAVLLATDAVLLFFAQKELLLLVRELPLRMSNGDENEVIIFVKSAANLPLHITVIDELPLQFQKRDFVMQLLVQPKEEKTLRYMLIPKQRGVYAFGRTHAIVSTPLRLWARRCSFGRELTEVPVYPSYLRMVEFEMKAISDNLVRNGHKLVRQPGQHTEFDKIKHYVPGENYRTINWNATARRNRLMVNTYQEERDQPVYGLIDMGRPMMLPIDGMPLLEYAVNAMVMLANVALKKNDKAGVVVFNTQIEGYVSAENRRTTLKKLYEVLYRAQTRFQESDYERLTAFVRKNVPQRSLLVLFTNFESAESVERQLNYFRHLSKFHLLLVVFFENGELARLANVPVKNVEDLYGRTIAEKFIVDKKQMVKRLNQYGIMSVYTIPENLTGNLLNKYIDLKRRGVV